MKQETWGDSGSSGNAGEDRRGPRLGGVSAPGLRRVPALRAAPRPQLCSPRAGISFWAHCPRVHGCPWVSLGLRFLQENVPTRGCPSGCWVHADSWPDSRPRMDTAWLAIPLPPRGLLLEPCTLAAPPSPSPPTPLRLRAVEGPEDGVWTEGTVSVPLRKLSRLPSRSPSSGLSLP